jgi:hypothetical protein
MSINGIIKDYYAYAGENISAGDLVEYVNGVAGKTDLGESVDTRLSSSSNVGYKIVAVQLDESRVFIAHSYGSSYYLYGIVCTINGANISYGNDTLISNLNYAAAYGMSAKLLPNGKIFIAYNYDNNQKYLMGIVCVIDGTTITAGTHKQLSNTNYTASAVSVEVSSAGVSSFG